MFKILLSLTFTLTLSLSFAQKLPDNIAKRDKFFDVEIIDTDVWIVGFPSIIIHSTDGGNSFEWQGVGEQEAFFAVDFIDKDFGWIAGRGGVILSTANGGKDWTKLISNTSEPLLDINFIDREAGWAVGNFGTIINTKDGGTTWSKQMLGDENDAVLNSVYFIDKKSGFIAGEFGTIAHTTDGGTNWELQESGTSLTLFSIHFIDAESGFCAGAEGTILYTEDAGKTWQTIDSGIRENLLKIVSNGKKTFAVGLDGIFLKKDDGGIFTLVDTQIYNWLDSISFNETGVVIAVGSKKTILYSSDWGKTFQRKLE